MWWNVECVFQVSFCFIQSGRVDKVYAPISESCTCIKYTAALLERVARAAPPRPNAKTQGTPLKARPCSFAVDKNTRAVASYTLGV